MTRLGWMSFVVIAALSPAGALAQEAPTTLGRLSFVEFCVSCHGADATGERDSGGELPAAPDLTRISERHGGTFPRERVHRIIGGLDEVPGHGGRMPAWSLILLREAPAQNAAEYVENRIGQLVDYLETIQRDLRSP
jgi:mono/diheme cytochrome c family protein